MNASKLGPPSLGPLTLEMVCDSISLLAKYRAILSEQFQQPGGVGLVKGVRRVHLGVNSRENGGSR